MELRGVLLLYSHWQIMCRGLGVDATQAGPSFADFVYASELLERAADGELVIAVAIESRHGASGRHGGQIQRSVVTTHGDSRQQQYRQEEEAGDDVDTLG